jgi:hypothetical protein
MALKQNYYVEFTHYSKKLYLPQPIAKSPWFFSKFEP